MLSPEFCVKSSALVRALSSLRRLRAFGIALLASLLPALALAQAWPSKPIKLILCYPPGGNVTGMQIQNLELIGKRIEILRELVPALSKLSILTPTAAQGSVTSVYTSTIANAGKALGVQIHHAPFRAVNELEHAFAEIKGNGSQAVLAISNPLTASSLKEILKLAESNRLPVIYESSSFVLRDGLISYGAIFSEVIRQAATFVDRLFRGAKAAELPVEQPIKYELAINLRTAKALGLTVPQSLLLRADEVVR